MSSKDMIAYIMSLQVQLQYVYILWEAVVVVDLQLPVQAVPITTKVVTSKGQKDKQRSTRLCTENLRSSNTNHTGDELMCPGISIPSISQKRPITSHGRNTSMLTLLNRYTSVQPFLLFVYWSYKRRQV